MKNLCLCLFLYSNITAFAQDDVIDLYGSLSKHAEISLSKIAKDVRYIPLETSEECLLSDELQIYYSPDFIFIGDQQTHKFYRFDKDGKFLNTIGKRGEGPEEYPMALFFYADEKEETVYIISSQSKSLYRYDYSGTFKGKVQLSESPWMIDRLGDGIVTYNNRFNRIKGDKGVKELFLFKPTGELIKSLPTTIKREEQDMLLFEFPFFYSYRSQLYYKNPLLDDVFIVEEGLKLKPVYKIDTGEATRRKDDSRNIKQYAQRLSVRSVFENDNLRLITYVHQDAFHYLYVNKETGETFNVGTDASGFADDIKTGPLFVPYRLFKSLQNVLIAVLPSGEASFLNRHPDDNPVIVVADLK